MIQYNLFFYSLLQKDICIEVQSVGCLWNIECMHFVNLNTKTLGRLSQPVSKRNTVSATELICGFFRRYGESITGQIVHQARGATLPTRNRWEHGNSTYNWSRRWNSHSHWKFSLLPNLFNCFSSPPSSSFVAWPFTIITMYLCLSCPV